jgi:hypothetical protein
VIMGSLHQYLYNYINEGRCCYDGRAITSPSVSSSAVVTLVLRIAMGMAYCTSIQYAVDARDYDSELQYTHKQQRGVDSSARYFPMAG